MTQLARHTLRLARCTPVFCAARTAKALTAPRSRRRLLVLLPAAKTRDPNLVLGPVQEALDYSRKLDRYSNEEDLIPGLGPVSLAGGALAEEARQRDLRDLYKVRLSGWPTAQPIQS